MTRYDDYPDHDLFGVPQEVLDVARDVLDGVASWNDVDPDDAHPLADAVVAALHRAGYLTWKEE